MTDHLTRRREWYAANRDRLLERKKELRREPGTGDAMRARDRAWESRNSTRKRHGLAMETVEALYAAQHGKCAICEVAAPMRGPDCLHIDHDHTTGERRGLLCFNCNRAIDVMERAGSTWALRALVYLGDPPLRRLLSDLGDGAANARPIAKEARK